MLRGNQHGGYEYDDLQNWLDMTSHENHLFCFAGVVGKNPKIPNLSPMADDAITQGGIGSLGSPVYIYLWLEPKEDWYKECNVFMFIKIEAQHNIYMSNERWIKANFIHNASHD